MAPSVTLSVLTTREGAMFEGILPHSFVLLCAAFQPCFTAPTYRTFRWLVAGGLPCPGRPTTTPARAPAGATPPPPPPAPPPPRAGRGGAPPPPPPSVLPPLPPRGGGGAWTPWAACCSL